MNYKRIISGLFIIGSIALFGFIKNDDDLISRIAGQLDKWLSTHPQEKVYLQLDKPYYAVGDDIWFKAYVTSGPNHQLSDLSGVLHVELIDDKDSVKQSEKLLIVSGVTWGDFVLDDKLKEGNYRIRAYTNLMRNAGEEYFFDKTITVVNSIKNNVFTKADYSFSNQAGQKIVNSVINYVDLNGTPYANMQVNYEVVLADKTINRGKGQTDEKGNLNISFVNTTPDLSKSGQIITRLKIADKKTVTKSVLIKTTSNNVDVQFFPEGGTLINGNYSKIAIKAVAADGLGTEVKGRIVDDQNNEIATFTSTHLGMGAFTITPESSKTYKAKLTYADGSENVIALPAAVSSGYSLSVVKAGAGNIRVRVIGAPGSSVPSQMALIGQSGGVIYYAAKSDPENNSFTTVIPKNKFPTGIVQFTLFSSTGEPMNERLVFIRNNDQLKLDVNSEKQTYAPRQKVKIDISARNDKDKAMIGIFSAAVTNESKVPIIDAGENTILSNLLLTADLKGYIEKPGYYFENVNGTTEANLDVLLLTQGYHRFEWKQVTGNKYLPIIYQPEKALGISGLIKTLGGKPIVNGKVTLITTAGIPFTADTVSNKEGRFVFKNLLFNDSVKFVVQARTEKGDKFVQIDLDNDAQQKISKSKNAPGTIVNPNNALSSFLQNSQEQYAVLLNTGVVHLREVVIKESIFKDSQNLNGGGKADQIIKPEDLFDCTYFVDCLQTKLIGVNFKDGIPYQNYPAGKMLVIVDGIEINKPPNVGRFRASDPDPSKASIASLDLTDIASIEVLRTPRYTSIYGEHGKYGVIIVTTKRNPTNAQIKAPGVITYMPKGFKKVREFYSPRYENPKINNPNPDLRSTIYWKPNLVTNKDGKTSFEFYNADSKGSYRVVVEGIDAEGNLGRQVYHYKVE